MQNDWVISRAREIFDLEIAGLQTVRDNLGEGFKALVDKCLQTIERNGKMVVCGIGKSGHIGAKIAATLASTGSPAVFLHPVEAMHGDLGILTRDDLLLAISYSGETEELIAMLPAVKRLGVAIVAISRDRQSQLAQWSDLTVEMGVGREACPFNLAPTTSTTALAALGDALALVLLQAQGFSEQDYALLHPSGAIGRTMTLRVADVMRGRERLAGATAETKIKDALVEMTRLRCGCLAVVDQSDRLLGIFTDGDFRRHITEDRDLLQRPVGEAMTANPVTVQPTTLAVELLRILEQHKIDDILVVDGQDTVLGIVDIQDMPKFKLL